jgi:hypothetical protein
VFIESCQSSKDCQCVFKSEKVVQEQQGLRWDHMGIQERADALDNYYFTWKLYGKDVPIWYGWHYGCSQTFGYHLVQKNLRNSPKKFEKN